MPMQHYRLNDPPKALPERTGAELSRFVQHTGALVVTMIEVSPPHRPRTTRATVLSVPFPTTQLFEEHVLPKLLLGDTDAVLSDRAYALVKTLPPRPEWKRRWILTAGPEAQIPADVLTGAVSAGVAFHYSRRGVVGLFTAVQDEPERLAAFTKAGWSVSAPLPGFLSQISMAMQRRPIAFQPFIWAGCGSVGAETEAAPDLELLPVTAAATTEDVFRLGRASLRERPNALAPRGAKGPNDRVRNEQGELERPARPWGLRFGVSATGEALYLTWNAISVGIDASGDRLAHALQSFAVRALEQEINVIAILPRDLNVQYALLPLEDAERVLVFDGQNRWRSASLPWKTLSADHLNALLRRFGARGNVSEPYPATFSKALMAAGIPSAATEALRILTAPEGDDLNEIVSLGNGALLLFEEPTDMLAADLLLALVAATGVRRPMLIIRPEGITLPRPIAEVAFQLVVDPNQMRLMLRDGGDHWMFEEHGAEPVMMLSDLMAEGQAVEGVEEDLVEGLGRNLVPDASPRSDAAGTLPLWLEGEEELRSPELGEEAHELAPEAGEVSAEVEAMAQPAGPDDQVGEEPVVPSVLEAAPPIVEVEAASWEDAPVGDDTLAIDWGTPPALDTLAELDEAPEGMAAEEPEELQTLPELSSELEMAASQDPLLARQDELEADVVEADTQPLEHEHEQAVATDSELLALAALDEAAELAPVAGDSREGHDDLAAAADDVFAPVAFDEGDADELEAVQFGDDDGLLDLGALGISLPSQPEMETELNASALSLPAEDGRFGQISGEVEAVEAVTVIVDFCGQGANEAETEAFREQQVDEARAEAPASARRRATAGHRGRRRVPAVAFFAAGPGAGELEVPAEHTITAAEDVVTSAPPVVAPDSAEVTRFDADIEALLAIGELAVDPLAEPEVVVEPVVELEPVAEPEVAVEPLAELDVVVVEAPAEPEAIAEALVEPAAELEQVQPASLAAADSAFAQGDLDAAEAGYRAVIESGQVENYRAARLGIGRIIAARRNPAPKPMADAPAPPAPPVSVDMPAEPAPVAVTPAVVSQDDRWSDAALFGAWSRGESIISLSRAYAAANPALTLAGAMARVREVVTTCSVANTGKGFTAQAQATIGTAGVVSETRLLDLAGAPSNGFTEQFLSVPETRSSDTAGVVSETPSDTLREAKSLDTGIGPMTNGSLMGALSDYAPMTNGSLAALGEHAQTLLPGDPYSDDEASNSAMSNSAQIELSPSQLLALIEAIKEDEQTHRATRFGRAIRVNWRKGLTFREQTRALKHLLAELDEEGLKRMVDAAVLPDIFLEQGEQLPRVIEAILGTTSDAAGKEHLEQVLMTLTLTDNPLRGSVRQRTLDRVRRYLEHRLNTLSNTTTEVFYAA